jgi:hypothetical protein
MAIEIAVSLKSGGSLRRIMNGWDNFKAGQAGCGGAPVRKTRPAWPLLTVLAVLPPVAADK